MKTKTKFKNNLIKKRKYRKCDPEEKMTMIHDVLIPFRAGSCCHAILCSLLESKNKFVTWEKILRSVEHYMIMFGGNESWKSFCKKDSNNKNKLMVRIKSNANSLTAVGNKTHNFKMHKMGTVIYMFYDGMLARTGGKYIPGKGRRAYSVIFADGSSFQKRSHGRSISYREYKDVIGGIPSEEIDEELV